AAPGHGLPGPPDAVGGRVLDRAAGRRGGRAARHRAGHDVAAARRRPDPVMVAHRMGPVKGSPLRNPHAMIAIFPSTILRALLVAVLLAPAPLRGLQEPDSLPSLLQRRVEAGVATGALWAGEQRLT